MSLQQRLSYVVPTIGLSPVLEACIDSLTQRQRDAVRVVAEATANLGGIRSRAGIEVLTVEPGKGFTGACNLGIATSTTEFVALVNDDAVVETGWAPSLVEALDRDSTLAAVQGVNLQLESPTLVDGCGIGWNRYWQAIQIGRNQPPPEGRAPLEIFGASGTAVVLRRQSLERISLAAGVYFDPRLGTYYEDVDLACRLRSVGYRAALLPAVRVRHAGASSSAGNSLWRWSRIYGNRLLVLARLWGRFLPSRLPVIAWRDARDWLRALATRNPALAAGIALGWARAGTRLFAFAHLHKPLVDPRVLARFRVDGSRVATA